MTFISLLPEEILGLITSTLSILDFCSFRLISREVNKKTFHNFGSLYFGTVQTDLSIQSIRKLQTLSSQGHITKHIHSFLVKDKCGTLSQDSLFNWNDYTSTDSFVMSSDIAVLSDILTNKLKSCRSFYIEDQCSLADIASFKQRRRSGSDAVAAILAIISQTGLFAKAFSLHLSPRGAARIDMTRLNIPLHYGPNLQSSWAHLQELSLVFTIDYDAFDWALSLILQAKNLRSLTLGLDIHESEAFFALLSDHGGLPPLETLELKSTRISKETLLTLLLHLRSSLQTLILRGIDFESGLWSSAFMEMRHSTSQLHIFQASCLNDTGGLVVFPSLRLDVGYTDTDDEGQLEVLNKEVELQLEAASIRYQGEDIDRALEKLSKSTMYYVNSPSSRGSKLQL